MTMDETRPLPAPQRDDGKAVFEFGDRTIGMMELQTFTLDDYGTRALPPTPVIATITEPLAAPNADPLARIEHKLDLMLNAITALSRRIDSIDETIARILNR